MNDRLPDDLRHRFTTAFGLDVAALQFHAGSPEPEALGVAAFARGREIHFAPGRFDPGGAPLLIAHELAHVVQQAEGRVAPTQQMPGGEQVNDDAALEAEADAAATKAVRGEAVRPGGAMLAPRAVDIAQAYFRSDKTGRPLAPNGQYCKLVYRHLFETAGEDAADEFQRKADDEDTDHGRLSESYDVQAVQEAVASRAGQGSRGGATGAAKKRRVGKSSERGSLPGTGVVEPEPIDEPKRKRTAKSRPRVVTPSGSDDERGERDEVIADDEDSARGRSRKAGKKRTSVKLPARKSRPRTPRRKRTTSTPQSSTSGKRPSTRDLEITVPTSTASPLTAWPESQTALRELAPHAPDRNDPTASWRHYWSALHHDLGQFRGVSAESYEAMLRGVTAVMLYKIHVASARSLDVPVEGSDIRQEAPQELDDSNVYYRSQDKGHPVITLYKDLITMANDGVERGRILAPYNSDVRALIESATPSNTPAKKAINTEDIQGVLHRQKPKPKKPPKTPPAEPVVYGKKHTEMSAGYIGLRQNNADVIESAVAKLFDAKLTVDQFLGYIAGEVGKAGGAPELPPTLALVDGHLAGVTSAIADLMASLTMLSVAPTPASPGTESTSEPTSEPTSKPTSEPTSGGTTAPTKVDDSGVGDGALERALLDPSYVVRKHADTAMRADWILQNVGRLQRIQIARTGDNPQITVQLVKHDKGLGDGEHITFVNAVRVYFGSLVTRRAAAAGASLAIAQRQSFGFLDSSVTDTGEAFRISVGNEPSEMLVAIRDALVALDGELANAAKAKPGARRKFAGQTGTKKQPLKTFAKSADAKYLGYWGAISGRQDLAAFLQGAPNISRQLAASPGAQRGGLMQRSSAEASLALGKLKRTTAKSTPVTGPMHDELAIVEPLQNMLLMAGDALTSCGGWDPTVLPHTRLAGLADLAAAVRRGQRAVDGYAKALGATHDTELRVATHHALRNATEDIMESLIVFLATTETFTSSPEDDMTELMRSLYDTPVDVFRSDGGEQAGAVAIAALRKEQTGAKQPFGLDIDTSHSYFEYESFLKQNSIEHGPKHAGASATFVDPRPFLTTIGDAFDGVQRMREKVAEIAAELRKPQKPPPAKSSKGTTSLSPTTPALPPSLPPQHTILLDVTNIDILSREVTQLVAGVRDLIDAKKLRVVLINSGVKHEQQGTDRYQVGRIVVIGEPLAEVDDTTDNSLISQFLHMAQRLRFHDAAPVTVHDRGYEARSLLATAARYTQLIDTYGAHDAWAEVLKTCERASLKPTGEPSKVLEVGTSSAELDASAADQAALRGLRLIDKALDGLIAELHKEKPGEVAYKVFTSLPAADQDFVRRVLAPDTGATDSAKGTGAKGGTGGSTSKPRVRAPSLQPPGPSTATGVSNVGNTCYLSAGLSVLAATDTYYAMFAPVHDEAPERAALRAAVRAILDAIRGGRAVADEAIEGLLDRLELRGLLPQPSAHDRQFGMTARTAQHDLSEVIFRKLIDHLGAPDTAHTTHVHQSDFRNQRLTATGGSAAQLSPLPESRVLREQQREVLIELPITQGDTLAAIVAALQRPERVDDVRVAFRGVARAGTALRSENFEGAPQVLAFALKRFDLLEKDERPIDMPAVIRWNGYAYALQAVAYHVGSSIGGGHYTASTRGTDGEWSYRNDSTVTPQTGEHFAQHKNFGTLFTYTRGAAQPQPQPQQPLPTPALTPTVPTQPTALREEHMEVET